MTAPAAPPAEPRAVTDLKETLRREIRGRSGCEPEDLPPPPPAPPKADVLEALEALWRDRGEFRFGQMIAWLVESAEVDGWGPGGLYDVEDADLLRAARDLLGRAAWRDPELARRAQRELDAQSPEARKEAA